MNTALFRFTNDREFLLGFHSTADACREIFGSDETHKDLTAEISSFFVDQISCSALAEGQLEIFRQDHSLFSLVREQDALAKERQSGGARILVSSFQSLRSRHIWLLPEALVPFLSSFSPELSPISSICRGSNVPKRQSG